MLIKAFFLFLILSGLFLNPVYSQAVFNGGDFSVDANWDGGTKPGPDADIVIATGASMNVDENYSCHSLTINELSSFSCSGGSILTIGTGGVYDKNGNKAIDVASSLQISSSLSVNPPYGTFTDARDGNVYNWVKIGTQIWMAENLKYLPSVVGYGSRSSTVPYYYVYGYDGTVVDDAKASENYNLYGALYNWPAAMNEAASSSSVPSGVQGACPVGWHLPSKDEWTVLSDYVDANSSSLASIALRSTSGWIVDATDEFGFSALPAGYLQSDLNFYNINYGTIWWSSTEALPETAFDRFIITRHNYFISDAHFKNDGYSIRCVRD